MNDEEIVLPERILGMSKEERAEFLELLEYFFGSYLSKRYAA